MPLTPQSVPVTDTTPADVYTREVMGIVVELRLISLLLAQGFGITDNLEALRNQIVTSTA